MIPSACTATSYAGAPSSAFSPACARSPSSSARRCRVSSEDAADLIIPGTAIVMATFDQIGVDQLRVSEYALREGVLVDALEAYHGSWPGTAP